VVTNQVHILHYAVCAHDPTSELYVFLLISIVIASHYQQNSISDGGL